MYLNKGMWDHCQCIKLITMNEKQICNESIVFKYICIYQIEMVEEVYLKVLFYTCTLGTKYTMYM